MSKVHILRKHPDENKPGQEAGLPPCPVCGAKAYIHSDTVDGYWFGWSVGCPRYCLTDKVHPHTENEEHLAAHGFDTQESAAEWWRKRVDRETKRGETNGEAEKT